MLGSAVSYADDVNIFLRNRWDNQIDQSDGKKSQVLFLIDVIAGNDTPTCHGTYTCYQANDDGSINKNEEVDCSIVDNNNNNGSCAEGCFDASSVPFRFNNNYVAYTGNIDLHFTGCFCPDASGGSSDSPGYWKVEDCDQAGVIDVRPVIQKVMQQRPDVKYGVMALASDKTAHMILDVESRNLEGNEDPTKDGSVVQTALYTSFPTIEHPELSDTAVFPTLGGMQSVESYLKGNLAGHQSPLTDECKYTQLVVITNGGWKNDVEADPSAALTALTQRLAENTVKPSCTAQVATSVIGINVPENNSADYPLFEGDVSVASIMASNGQGIYENVKPNAGETDPVEINKQIGTGILNSVLGIIDFSYDQPTALITPVAPVSISRGHNLDVLYASSFKAQGEPNWPGNIIKADSDSIPPSNFDSSSFSFPADRTSRQIKTICGEQLCNLTADAGDFTAEDLAWLQGVGIAEDTDVLGDIVHFRPLPIHYGNVDGDLGTISANEIYVVVGTNRGLLHIFDYNGNELWAFLPPQLKPMVSALRQGYIAPAYNMVNHFYGVDGAPSVFIYDDDKDGLINDGDDDRVLLYYGLRRGGAGYFAMDITTPTAASLLWQIGGSELDYGDKPDAEIVSGTIPADKEEKVDPLLGSGGGCPMFAGMQNSFGSPAKVAEICSAAYPTESWDPQAYCLYPFTDKSEVWNNPSSFGPAQGGVLDFGHAYFAGVCGKCDVDGNPVCQQRCVGQTAGTPVYTIKNQCIPNISSPQTEATFDAHVSSQFMYKLTGSICYLGATLQGQIGSGGLSGRIGVGNWPNGPGMETIVGFDISGLPEDITIESAQITFGHHGDGDVSPNVVYETDKVFLYASDKGFWGNDAKPDGYDSSWESLGSSDDCRDAGYFQTGTTDNKIARIQKPSSYTRGSRTTDGVFLSSLSQEDREAKLTGLFTDCWSGSGTEKACLHDMTNGRNNRWVQFKVKRDGTSSSRVAWGRAIEGPQVANDVEDGYWDKTVPKLHLKWRYNNPTDPVLTIKQTGDFGTVTAQNLTDLTSAPKECDEDECAYTYSENDSIKLTASLTNFDGWTGDCVSITDNVCTVTMDAAKTVTANYSSTTPVLNIELKGGSGSVNVYREKDGTGYGDDFTEDDSLAIAAGSAVTLTPADAADFDNWVISDVTPNCDDTTKVCTFTMPSVNVTATATFNSGPTCNQLGTPKKCSDIYGIDISDGTAQQTLTDCDYELEEGTGWFATDYHVYTCSDADKVKSSCTVKQSKTTYAWQTPSIPTNDEYGYEKDGKYYTDENCTQ